MAQKGGYPPYPGAQPPPPMGYAPPPYQAQGATNTVIIQQQQPVVVGKSSRGLFGGMMKELDKMGSAISREADRAIISIDKSLSTSATSSILRGLFGQLGHELNVLGNTVSREVNWATKQVNQSLAATATTNLLSLFQTGNVIQLVSRANGGCLQIVQGPQGLVLDGRGQQGAQNATWTIVNEGNNQVRLNNNNNFLSIINGATVVLSMPAGVMHGVETKFQLVNVGQFVYLESMKERGRHVGVLPTGEMKSALATGRDMHAQFGVRLMYSPYQPATVTTVTTKR